MFIRTPGKVITLGQANRTVIVRVSGVFMDSVGRILSIAVMLLSVLTHSHAEARESAAVQRFRTKWQSKWSNALPKQASIELKYMAVKGLGYTEGVIRRDPTDIIQVDDLYFLWYTRSAGGPLRVGLAKATDTLRAYPWDLADIWLATSPDGHTWTEQGPAVKRGPKGSYDARSVFTPNILVAKGKYFLFYQTAPDLSQGEGGDFAGTKIGMSWAESPHGPWTRAHRPLLSPGNWGDPGDYPKGPIKVKGDWDGKVVHDPSLIARNGQYYLYYKSLYFRGSAHRFMEGDLKDWVTKEGGIPIGWGVAIADQPEGPYVKSELNPVIVGGHECIIWPYAKGICALVTEGPEKNTIQYAEDGLNFKVIDTVKEAPIAAGIFRPDFSDQEISTATPKRTCGISHVVWKTKWHHLRQFEFTKNLSD